MYTRKEIRVNYMRTKKGMNSTRKEAGENYVNKEVTVSYSTYMKKDAGVILYGEGAGVNFMKK
jgi:hypothetical protein